MTWRARGDENIQGQGEMVRTPLLLVVAFVGAAFLGAIPGGTLAGEAGTRVAVPGGAYTNITAPALKRMLEHTDFFFVNVHIPYQGEIAGTDAFIPYDKVEEQLHLLPPKKDAKVLLYCMSDRMSTIAAETLVRLGYTNVLNLEGGMTAWRTHGYPLLSGPR